MPLFHRESPEEKQQKEAQRSAAELEADLQAKSLRSLESGGLPLHAQERVNAIRQALENGAAVALASSDLSVSELLLARQTGYQPVGLVAGSCIYHIGWNRWTLTGELDAQTAAMSRAGNSAIDRLRLEARGMGALGVIGVKLEIRRPGWSEHLIEVVAHGTAIRAIGAAASAESFVSGMSAQEYIALLKVGSRPSGIAFGNSTYYVYTNWNDARQNISFYNQEVVKYTESIYAAQRLAFGRMHDRARELRAGGVVGVHFHHTLHRIEETDSDGDANSAYDDYVLEYLAWGTAVIEAPAAAQVTRPSMLVDLKDLARPARPTAVAQGGELP